MAQTIKLKRSATQGAVPSTSALALGEIAINTYDGNIFIKKNDGSESIVTIGDLSDNAVTSAKIAANAVQASEIATNAVGISELNVSDGANGQVLTTDGAGSLSFSSKVSTAQSFYLNSATGDGSTTDFSLSTTPAAESNIIAFIDGVFQTQDSYTFSGTTLSFSAAPPNGTKVVVYVVGAIFNGNSVVLDTFSGDGSTTAFTLSENPENENNTQIYIDGVYQQKSEYSISSQTLTFSSAPPSGTNNIEVVSFAVTNLTVLNANSVESASIATGAVGTTELADDAVTIGKIADAALVIESEGISSNDNDTTLPTSAAVKDYVDTQVATVDTLPEVLANGNTTGGTDISVSTGDDITFADSSKAIFGASSDLQIFHDGSNSIVQEVGTGDLRLAGNVVRIRNSADTENMISAVQDGAVTLCFDGNGKLATTSTGIDVTGEVEATALDINGNGDISGNLTLGGYLAGPATFTIDPAAVGDNTGTVVIAGNLQVDGTTTTINSTTMTVDDLNITLASGAANAAAANGAGITVDGASATITYDGTNDEWDFNKDINVTGTATMDGLTVNSGTTDQVALFESTDQFADLALKDSGGTSYIRQSNGSLILEADRANASSNSVAIIKVDNSEKMRLDSTGVGIGTTTPQKLLHVSDLSGSAQIMISSSDSGVASLQFSDAVGGSVARGYIEYDNSTNHLALGTGAAERLRIDSSGNVGIGTTSPDRILDIEASVPAVRLTDTTTSGMYHEILGDGNSLSIEADDGNVGASSSINFKVDGSEKVRIDSSGNVGIGTASPDTKLHVEGGSVLIDAYSVGEDAGLFFREGFLTTDQPSITVFDMSNSGASPDGLSINAYDGIRFRNAGAEVARFSNEKFGIGTTSPSKQLTISGDNAELLINRTGTYADTINMGCPSGVPMIAGGTHLAFGGSGTWTEHMRITSAGNVGIGVADPTTYNASDKLALYSTGNTSMVIAAGTSGESSVFMADGTSSTASYMGYLQYHHSDNHLRIGVNAAERIRIDSVGAVGINTTSPDRRLHVVSAAVRQGKFEASGSGEAGIEIANSDGSGELAMGGVEHLFLSNNTQGKDLFFKTTPSGGSDTERMRITSAGNVGIGTASPSTELHVYSADQNALKIQTNSAINQIDISNSTNSPTYITANSYALELKADDNGWGGTASAIKFNVKATERMRITSGGSVLIGTSTTPAYAHKLVCSGSAIPDGTVSFRDTDVSVGLANAVMSLGFTADSDATSGYFIYMTDANGAIGSIQAASGTSVSFNTTSDERLKKNIVDASPQLDIIKSIKVREFDWTRNDHHELGLIAQELVEIVPNVVTVGGEDETKNPYGVDYGKLTPYLIKAIQEQQTIIDDLKSRIETLEG